MAPPNIFRSLQSIRSNMNEDEFRVLDPSSGPRREFRTQTRVQDPDTSSGPRHEFRFQSRVQDPDTSSGPRRLSVYSFSSDLSLALALVTLMSSCLARSTISLRFCEETVWAISAA